MCSFVYEVKESISDVGADVFAEGGLYQSIYIARFSVISCGG